MTTQTDLAALNSALSAAASAGAVWSQQVAAGTPYTWAEAVTLAEIAAAQKAAVALGADITPAPPITPPPLVLVAPSTVSATVGTAITPITLNASGGTPAYTFSANTLPTGISLSGNIISGTPSTAGNSAVNVTVTDSGSPAQKVTETFTITVTAVTPPPASGVVISQPTTTGGPPGARGQGYGCFDQITGNQIYFGGNNGPAKNDTWMFNPVTNVWKQVATGSGAAPANVAVSLGYDPISKKIIMFGGDNESTFFNTTYSMDTSVANPVWTLLNPSTKPPIRSGHSCFNDPVSGALMIYGGNTGTPTYYDDLWKWTGTNWTEVSSALTGTARTGAFADTDTKLAETLIFGGFTNDVTNDTHVWNGTTCVKKTPATVPSARGFGGCATNGAGLISIYGGTNRLSKVNQSDWWTWDGTNWTKQTPTGSALASGGLSSQSMNFHPPSGKIICAFGTAGASVNQDINTVYEITVGGSTPVTPPPVTPPPAGGLPPLGFYGNGGNASNANATAKTLGVTAQGCSNYCDGTSWASIGSSTWTKSDASPLPAFVGVNLCPGAGNQKTGGLGQAAANASQFTNLAKVFNAKTDIARPGWEWDGNWFAWGVASGGLNAGNTTAKYIADFQACVTALRAGCPGLRIDWCGNSGSSSLAQLEAAYPGDAYVDIIGFDHYDAGSVAANLAAVTATIQFAAQRGKPIGIGEWGAASNGTDNPAFIDFMAMLTLNPKLFSSTYNLPAYTVAYSSLFTDSSNNITNKPNMIKEFPIAFAGE